ncbi:MAG: V-type ATP synthase subunit B [Candidatus Competibacterales bacterium]
MDPLLVHYQQILAIVGDIVRVRVPPGDSLPRGRFGDLAFVEGFDEAPRAAQVIGLDGEVVTLQVFNGTRGLSTRAAVRFSGRPLEVTYSNNILGRVFNGTGRAIDGGPNLHHDPQIPLQGPTVNPVRRVLASKMIRTDVPMIDLFNCLVESQKIPIFATAGEPYNPLLARIGIQADAEVVVFGGVGLIFDDVYFFQQAFEEAGVLARTVMFVNQASDPVAERLLVPDMALAVAERFAVEEGRRVLVLLTDMTAFADALREIGVAMDQVPANRGYTGDLYSQLARRYEKACDFAQGGSVTVLAVTTMPGNDVTHPVPDNTGYITEGQFYLHGGKIDPFGSLSRLKQHVIGQVTREDHGQVMNAMVRLYAGARDALQKQAMAFDLSPYDRQLLAFGERFEAELMALDVAMPLETALDRCWHILADCFGPDQVLIRQSLIDTYWPTAAKAESSGAEPP